MPQRILILVVAYNAEHHIQSVLERIPPSLNDGAREADVLVLDDASTDHTWNVLQAVTPTVSKALGRTIMLGRNSFNQGYGGNQKIGYRYAINHGYDYVLLLHGDGQYPPEHIAPLLAPLEEGTADAVLGSRMRIRKNALKGHMPLHKWAGNILLTTLQNLILGTRLSEFHTGFRAYRVKSLAEIPFEANFNDFGFDTDILIQLLENKKRITETDIPTHYGDEICHVNAPRYAVQCLWSCAVARTKVLGIFYQRKFDYSPEDPGYTDKTGFESSHSWATRHVPANSRVLEVGCGRGFFISQKLAEKGCEVYAMDQFPIPREALPENVHYRMLDRRAGGLTLTAEEKECDHVVLLDVIEHLDDPEHFLSDLRAQLQQHLSVVYITTSNIAFLLTRICLLLGQFNYGKKGILDRTHKRLFTFRSLMRTLRDANYVVERVEGIAAPIPLVIKNKTLCALLMAINSRLVKLWKGLFAYQIAIVARATPTVETLIIKT